MWMGDELPIKEWYGVSFIDHDWILARLPQAIIGEVEARFSSGGTFMLILELGWRH